jgi:hypothetical protein
MTVPVSFRPQADAEVQSARLWYEGRRSGLGDQFLAALDQVIERVSQQPESFPRIHRNIRRALVERFPFGLYFEIIDHVAVVLGVVHGHRDPKTWRSRR